MENLTLQRLVTKTQEALEQAGASDYYKSVFKTVTRQLLFYAKDEEVNSFSMDFGIQFLEDHYSMSAKIEEKKWSSVYLRCINDTNKKVKVLPMSKPNKNYEPEFKQKIVRLVLEEGRTLKSVNDEYSLGEGIVRNWIRKFNEECESNPDTKDTKDLYEENRRLRKELAESQKENAFLKKAAAFFAKELD